MSYPGLTFPKKRIIPPFRLAAELKCLLFLLFKSNFSSMSKAEILEELPKLTPADRSQLFARLAELHEADLISSELSTAAERKILDAALAEFERDSNPGEPWRDVLHRIREPKR